MAISQVFVYFKSKSCCNLTKRLFSNNISALRDSNLKFKKGEWKKKTQGQYFQNKMADHSPTLKLNVKQQEILQKNRKKNKHRRKTID